MTGGSGPSPKFVALAPGRVLEGRYRIESVLGRGGSAIVYRAVDEFLQQPVALKVLLHDGIFDSDGARTIQLSLREEALAGMSVSHHNLLRVFHYARHSRWEFLVMELVDGLDLHQVCRRSPERRLGWEKTINVGLECLDALAHAHRAGLVHNDIKPANLLMSADGTIKLCDFGLAVRHAASESARCKEVTAGTPAFMSPEVVRGIRHDPRGDLYSLAATLFCIGNGAPPFGSGDGAIVHHLKSAPPKSQFLPGAVDEVLRVAMAKDPARRFPSADAMASALRRALGQLTAERVLLLPPRIPPVDLATIQGKSAAQPAKETATTNEVDSLEFVAIDSEPLPVVVGGTQGDFVLVPGQVLESSYGGKWTVPSFQIRRTPVTNAEYAEFVNASGARAPSGWKGRAPPPNKLRHPVVGVSLEDARKFAAWKGLRLPSSLEWEAAARGPDGARFPWGKTYVPANCNGPIAGCGTTVPVDAHPEGASPHGCLQMVGNVWEWTEYDERQPSPVKDTVWVLGGSFRHSCIQDGAIPRIAVNQRKVFEHLGFRCVRP